MAHFGKPTIHGATDVRAEFENLLPHGAPFGVMRLFFEGVKKDDEVRLDVFCQGRMVERFREIADAINAAGKPVQLLQAAE